MADLPTPARIGDTIECDIRHPFSYTIRMRLDTPAAVAHGNELLLDPKSGWRLSVPVNPLCGVHGPLPCEGAGCICTRGVEDRKP